MIFNELIEKMEQMKNKKNTLEVPLDFKNWYRMKKILHLNFYCLVLPKNSKTLYTGYVVIANIFLGTADVRYKQAWL